MNYHKKSRNEEKVVNLLKNLQYISEESKTRVIFDVAKVQINGIIAWACYLTVYIKPSTTAYVKPTAAVCVFVPWGIRICKFR